MIKHKVYNYQTGEELPGEPTAELVRESMAAEPTGAVGAYLAGGEWRWLDAGDPAPCGAVDCRTVYVVAHEDTAEPDLDLTPISVGFDLRVQKMLVTLPAPARHVRYDLDGQTREAIGTTEELVKVLEAAGYTVKVTP